MCLPPQSLLPPCYPGSTMCHTTSSEKHTTPSRSGRGRHRCSRCHGSTAIILMLCKDYAAVVAAKAKAVAERHTHRMLLCCARTHHCWVDSLLRTVDVDGGVHLACIQEWVGGWVGGWSSRCHPTLQLLQQGDALVYIYPYAYAKAVHTRGQACSAATSMLEAAGIHAHMQEQLRCRPHLFGSP